MLKELRYELLRGLAYRQIRHQHMGKYTTWLPLILAFMSVLAYAVLPIKPALLGEHGAISDAMTLIGTLPGFYFAGLAAVATFGGTALDLEMPDPAPKIAILTRGKFIESKLTRRQFLSYLFSYLVLLSFIICAVLLLVNTLGESIILAANSLEISGLAFVRDLCVYCFVFIVSLMLGSMLITTLQGVFFLTEKIHQPR